MVKNKLDIAGFKCFKKADFELSDVTVLSGSNGTGKSSVIQALLLARIAIEHNVSNAVRQAYVSDHWRGQGIPLNSEYNLQLGTVFDVFNDKAKEIVIKLDTDVFRFSPPVNEKENLAINVQFESSNKKWTTIPFWRQAQFYYLAAERLGPKHYLNNNSTDFPHCGYQGEYTAQVMLEKWNDLILDQRHFPNTKSDKLAQQVDAWLDYVCPGVAVTAVPLNNLVSQIVMRHSATKKNIAAPNIGFGISYVLPIIVTGLIAQKDSILIVENPEAHLHPKGQSNIGFFLGRVAAAGVKILIETHSEHVVNGLRRSLFTEEPINPSNLGLYFFNGFNPNSKPIQKIEVKRNADLSDFPEDFYDQVRQDLLFILQHSNNKGWGSYT